MEMGSDEEMRAKEREQEDRYDGGIVPEGMSAGVVALIIAAIVAVIAVITAVILCRKR